MRTFRVVDCYDGFLPRLSTEKKQFFEKLLQQAKDVTAE